MSRGVRLWFGLLLAATLTLVAWSDFRQATPGPLLTSHAQIAALQGRSGCLTCHSGGPQALAQACLDCHSKLATQIERGHGLHAQLPDPQLRDCASCHAEHLASDSARLTAVAFAGAGIEDAQAFDHGDVDFRLGGRHASLQCQDCHPAANHATLAEGEARFLDRTQTCTDCHDDPHQGAMRRDCEDCHGQEHAFDDLSAFPHDSRVPLHAAHAGLACHDCHASSSPWSVEALSDPQQQPSWRGCAACHENPHHDDFLAGQAPATRGPGEDDCVQCHRIEDPSFHQPQIAFLPDWHAASGFPLIPPHDSLQCEDCHPPRSDPDDFTLRYPGRLADDCRSCHQDPHGGQFDPPQGTPADCLACHYKDSFLPHTFDLDQHAAVFVLDGAHRATSCESCHPLDRPSDPQSRRFRPVPQRCEQCHADAHRAFFASREATLKDPEPGRCARCHDTDSFRVEDSAFDHQRWTGFALDQGHAGLDCEACHARTPTADATGRTLGWVLDLYPVKAEACAGCHADPHGGAFATPVEVNGRLACARCHDTHSFSPAIDGAFDHRAWTAFPLTGAHAQTACASCHPAGADGRPALARERFPEGQDWDCARCHDDVHRRAFADPGLPQVVDGQQDCARCHHTESFRAARIGFDHGGWTGFPLQGAHADATCASCHPPLTPPQGERQHGFARGSSCLDCHADPHLGQFNSSPAQDCLHCHDRQTRSFSIAEFDHDRLTRFPLDDSHRDLSCVSCHPQAQDQHGRSAVRYRPLGRNCADCHAVEIDGSGGGD